jgi:uncharacterized membrane protein/predicted DsbA family dithiol-disulfide isomerase
MARASLLVVFRFLVLIALAVSAALLHDYSVPMPAFCAAGEGCDKIRESAFAHIGGLSTPLLGVLAFAGLYTLSIAGHDIRRRWMVPVAAAGALAALGFLCVQAFLEHTFCKLCVVVDTSAVLAAVVVIAYRFKGNQGHDGSVSRPWWIAAGLLAVVAPFLFAWMQPPPPVAPAIARYWQPGKVNVVELSDFECPFCRLQHLDLKAALESYGDRVNFVRVTAPLPGHTHARSATRAYFCAKDQNLGEPMADALFAADDLSTDGLRAIATRMQSNGLTLDSFERCFADPRTEERVSEAVRTARDEIGFKGLPTLWIGSVSVIGRRSVQELRSLLEQQAQGGSRFRPTASAAWLWTLLVVGFVGLSLVSVRPRRLLKKR